MTGPSVLAFDVASDILWHSLGIGVGSGVLFVLAAIWLLRRRPAARPVVQRRSKPTGLVKGPERRTAVRRHGALVTVLLREGQETTHSGWVVDRSCNGLRLSAIRPIPAQTPLRVRPVDAPTTLPWVDLRVKSCRLKEGRWEIGCEFVRIPPWSVRVHFG